MIIMNIDDSLAIKPRATNWEEPAKTIDDSAKAPYIERSLLWDRVPYIIPNGMAPIIRGIVSITPLVNSIFWLLDIIYRIFFMNENYHRLHDTIKLAEKYIFRQKLRWE